MGQRKSRRGAMVEVLRGRKRGLTKRRPPTRNEEFFTRCKGGIGVLGIETVCCPIHNIFCVDPVGFGHLLQCISGLPNVEATIYRRDAQDHPGLRRWGLS